MTDRTPHMSDPPDEEARRGQGEGCAMGGGVLLFSVIGGILAVIALRSILPEAFWLQGWPFLWVAVSAILIAWPVRRWRTRPGFFLGMGLTVAIAAVALGACFAILSTIEI